MLPIKQAVKGALICHLTNLCFWQNEETRKSHFSLKCCISRERCSTWTALHAVCCLPKRTRRPASADRTARRQFQANGQPVSRTQASDAMTSRLPHYEAKCVWGQYQGNGAIPCQYIDWYHSKGHWLRYNFAADSFYIMKLCSRLFVLPCRSRPKFDRSRHLDPHYEEVRAA